LTQTTDETGAWSIFQQGGGAGSAFTWAKDALNEIGAPLTTGNEQVIYDWELSEAGGGWYNPLNEGPDPDNPSLSGPSQYGGGAANYVSYAAGLQGFHDYLQMPNFSAIGADLTGNNPTQARTDIINSDWAGSHYDWGAAFSDSPLPGKANALKGGAGITDATTTSFLSGATGFLSDIGSADFWERAGLIFFGAILIIVGIIILAMPAVKEAAGISRSVRSIGAAIPGGGGSGGPTEEEKADRTRRLSLAEENTRIGAEKVRIQGMREARLSGGKRHQGNREPNPSPAHS